MWILFSFSWLVFLKVCPLFLSLAPKNQLLSWLIFSVLLKLQISLISYFILHKFSLQFLYLLYLFYADTIIHSVPPHTNLKLSLTPHDSSTCLFYLICISNLCSAVSHSKRNFINVGSSHWLLLSSFTPLTSLQHVKLPLASKPFLYNIYHTSNFSFFCELFDQYSLTRLKSSGGCEPSLSCSPV